MPQEKFHRQFDLPDWRRGDCLPKKKPMTHQMISIEQLKKWHSTEFRNKKKGVILSLPTGSGKTFVAVRFLCQHILPKGYRVLWMAETHHLLEQAYYTFAAKDDQECKTQGVEVAHVAFENPEKKSLNIRVISGEQNHYKLNGIKDKDDVLICTIKTVSSGRKTKHPKIEKFLAKPNKVFIVFDEAHHSPARTYRELLMGFQAAGLPILGLTATPTYSDIKKRGCLSKIYPQLIIPADKKATMPSLIAKGVLARPKVLEPKQTNFEPTFTVLDIKKWLRTNKDLPEDTISKMAKASERNEAIAKAYVQGQKEFGKTIIFADRWYQCEAVCELLKNRGVKAGAVYSHVTVDRLNADERNFRRRGKSQIAADLQKFKDGKLQVIVNINILTEGTDVPDVKTVFITRQTSSKIRLQQMVGRALRGPKMNGNKEANIVMFQDKWQLADILGKFAELPQDVINLDDHQKVRNRKPVEWIAIELIRKLTQQMDSGSTLSDLKFSEYFPIGWYQVSSYEINDKNPEEDVPFVENIIMVLDHEKTLYDTLIKQIKKLKRQGHSIFLYQSKLQSKRTIDSAIAKEAEKSQKQLSKMSASQGEIPLEAICSLYRHFLENDTPIFFPIENREKYDMETLAKKYNKKKIDGAEEYKQLEKEFNREDRLWKSLYHHDYDLFKRQLDDHKMRSMQKKAEATNNCKIESSRA